MRRWWYYVAKERPLNLSSILDLVGSVPPLRAARTLFVAVGSDVRRSDAMLLESERTPWGARMVRRATPGDGTGHVLIGGTTRAAAHRVRVGDPPHAGGGDDSGDRRGVDGGRARGTRADNRSAGGLTYAEAALVDLRVCRAAEWLVGWPASSFSATLAHMRHLDRSPNRGVLDRGVKRGLERTGGSGGFWAYCAQTPRVNAGITYWSAERMPPPTLCRTLQRRARASSSNATASNVVFDVRCTPAAESAAAAAADGDGDGEGGGDRGGVGGGNGGGVGGGDGSGVGGGDGGGVGVGEIAGAAPTADNGTASGLILAREAVTAVGRSRGCIDARRARGGRGGSAGAR